MKFTETPLGSVANAWDAAHRRGRSDYWFEGAKVYPSSRSGFEKALQFGGDKIQAHGMAKAPTLGSATEDLLKMLKEGLDPQRRGGQLDTAPIVGTRGAGAGLGTAGGGAYSDGPYMLVQRPKTDGLTGKLKNLGAILVNDANAEMVEPLRKAVQAIRADVVVDTYGNAGGVAKYLQNPQTSYVSENIKVSLGAAAEDILPAARTLEEVPFPKGSALPAPPAEIRIPDFPEEARALPKPPAEIRIPAQQARLLPPPPAEIRLAEYGGRQSVSAKNVGRSLLPVAKRLGTALGTETASIGKMALRGAGRLAGPVGIAMTAYDLAQAFPAPAPISEEDMGKALRSYRTGPQPAY